MEGLPVPETSGNMLNHRQVCFVKDLLRRKANIHDKSMSFVLVSFPYEVWAYCIGKYVELKE